MGITWGESSTLDGAMGQNAHCGPNAAFINDTYSCVDGAADGGTITDLIFASSTLSAPSFTVSNSRAIDWAGGSWTVRLNVTTSNMNLTLVGVYICRVNSDGSGSLETLGSATGLSISLGSTGVKSQAVTTSSATSPGATDRLKIFFDISNSAMTNQSYTITTDQVLNSPLGYAASPVSVERRIVNQAVNRAATY